jgi:hypothetical protein
MKQMMAVLLAAFVFVVGGVELNGWCPFVDDRYVDLFKWQRSMWR